MSAQDLIQVYVDALREAGGHRDDRQVGRIARKIRGLLEEGVEEDVVSEAIVRMVSRGFSESWRLGGFVNDILLARRTDPDRKLLDNFLAEHDGRWPTGVRFVRGSHSGSWAPDPLGYDQSPDGFRPRPKRDDVIAALRERRAKGDE